MSQPLLSIIVLQYRPNPGDLLRTLCSITRQDCRDFELLVADDGSDVDYFAETRRFLARYGFENVTCVKMQPNGGTVRNLLNGVEHAAGRWVFSPSPGDYLYDAGTVRWLLENLRRDEPPVLFGRLAYYCEQDGVPVQRPGDVPFDKTPYKSGAFDARRAKRDLLLYDDGICGAGMVYDRLLLRDTLRRMAGHVRYAEDFSARLFAVENVPVAFYDRPITWYQVGTGISTDKTAASEQRLLTDWKAMLDLMRRDHPHDRTVRAAHLYYHNDERRSRLVRGLIGRLIVPQNQPFKKAQRAWQPPTNGDKNELTAIYAAARQEEFV